MIRATVGMLLAALSIAPLYAQHGEGKHAPSKMTTAVFSWFMLHS